MNIGKMRVTWHYYQFTHESLCLAYQTVEEYQLSFSVGSIERLAATRQNEPNCLMLKNTPQHWQGFQRLQNNKTLDKTIRLRTAAVAQRVSFATVFQAHTGIIRDYKRKPEDEINSFLQLSIGAGIAHSYSY
jgi:hypothetical protein